MTSTLSRTNSVAISMKRSLCPLRPPILQRDGATLDPAEFAQPLHKGGDPLALDRRSCGTQVTDGRHFRRLLRARRERPRGRAAEQRDEVAPPHHSITSSASASRLSEILTPSAFEVDHGLELGRLHEGAHALREFILLSTLFLKCC